MTLAAQKLTFEEYLAYDDGLGTRYLLIDGALIAVPPESEPNIWTATALQFRLARWISLRLIKTHTCEVQVPVLQEGDAQNRFPDLVVLREEHLTLTSKRLTITREMPPPVLIAEMVSPGKVGRERDYVRKRSQYARIGVAEYWLIDRDRQGILVLELHQGDYREIGWFTGDDRLVSLAFPAIELVARQILTGT
jgi:Uma2 family endonuclease